MFHFVGMCLCVGAHDWERMQLKGSIYFLEE